MSGEKIEPHILFVEDDPDDQLLLREAFIESQIPYAYTILENGEQLLDLLYHRSPHSGSTPRPALIVMDIRLPGRDGFQILPEIRNSPEHRLLPVVFLTSFTETNHIQQAYEAGANSYLVKPDSFLELVSLLKILSHYWLEINQLPYF
jgi:CheY-like chemotaxis protein